MYTDLFALDQAARRERELTQALERRRLAAEREAVTPRRHRGRLTLVGRWLVVR